MEKGSIFNKWDLHIHTPDSFQEHYVFENEEEKMLYENNIWNKFIHQLEQINDIPAIGITDYFSISGYKKVKEYIKSDRLRNFELILPNIEFRLDKLLHSRHNNGSAKRLNYHIIFTNEIDPLKIEEAFLEELHIINPSGETRKLTKNNIIEIGRTLKSQHENFRHLTDYYVGCMNVTVKLEEIKKILREKPDLFKGKYISVLDESDWCLMGWDGQDHLPRKELYIKSNALFSSNSNTRDWALGKKSEDVANFIDEFKALKPCIHGSDAHDFQSLGKPDLNRFCWIKSDITFEGLKQILYEPSERVLIQETDPNIKNCDKLLSEVNLSQGNISQQLIIEERTLPLHQNLVCVIGGKGSGKTAILDLIANCFVDRCGRKEEDKNSFVQRIEADKSDYRVKIHFKDGESFDKELIDETYIKNLKLTYLPQGRIEKYISNQINLHQKIQEIVFRSPRIYESEERSDYNHIHNRIQKTEFEITDLNLEINRISLENNLEKLEYHRKELIQRKEKTRIRVKNVLFLKKDLDIDSRNEVDRIQNETDELNQRNNLLKIANDKIEKLLYRIEDIKNINSLIDNVNSMLPSLDIDVIIPKIENAVQKEQIKNIMKELNQQSDRILINKKQTNQTLDILNKKQHELAKSLDEISVLKQEISHIETSIEMIEQNRIKLKNLVEKRTKLYKILISNYFTLKEKYNVILSKFSEGKHAILEHTNFKGHISFDKDLYLARGLDILDNRSVNKIEIEVLIDLVIEGINNDIESSEINSKINQYIERIQKLKKWIKTKTRNEKDFYNWIFGNFYSLTTRIFLNETPLENLSIGQKGTVLLKIILADGDHLLIIDQPEENLDNRFIYDVLVEAFKKAKYERQIIIATHNPNLVVNTDSEQIVIAEYQDNKLVYQSGSLENLRIRTEITTLLEGGKEAFMRREQKYGFH